MHFVCTQSCYGKIIDLLKEYNIVVGTNAKATGISKLLGHYKWVSHFGEVYQLVEIVMNFNTFCTIGNGTSKMAILISQH